MKIIITGAAGFLGRYLTQVILKNDHLNIGEEFNINFTELVLIDLRFEETPYKDDKRVVYKLIDITEQGCLDLLLPAGIIFHLAAIVSSQAEADFDLGMRVNFDATRNILEGVRKRSKETSTLTKFIFTSSLAVYGGELLQTITECTALKPQSSYGSEKALCEILIHEYNRKGFIDGRILRLPIVTVRSTKPNKAASSFVSNIIREPLYGLQTICPVKTDLLLWISSPETVVKNLLHASQLNAAQLGIDITINLPGITVTVQEMIDSLGKLVKHNAQNLIRYEIDLEIERIVGSWPKSFQVEKALNIGFYRDSSFDNIIKNFISQHSSEIL